MWYIHTFISGTYIHATNTKRHIHIDIFMHHKIHTYIDTHISIHIHSYIT